MAESEFTSRRLYWAAEDGDLVAEGMLVERYFSQLLTLAANRLPAGLKARVDPDDIVQSACRVFINKLRRGDVDIQQRGDLWKQLVSVTLNKIRSSTRKHGRAKRTSAVECTGAGNAILSREPTPDDACMFVETVDMMLSALPKDRQRQVVVLRLQGESTAAISKATGYSIERVRQIIRWVRTHLEGDPPGGSVR